MRFRLPVIALLGSGLVLAGACGGDDAPMSFCGPGQVRVSGQCLQDLSVAVNTVGLLPERAKRVTFVSESSSFEVVDAASGEVVYSGDAEGPVPSVEGAPDVFVGDFSDFSDSGEFYIQVEGGRSGSFRVGDDALDDALDAAMLGLYGQRCGETVAFDRGSHTYAHGACHLEPASLARLNEEGARDDTGGWHDAGDYGKYVRNGAFAVAFLLSAYEHFPELLKGRDFEMPERGGSVPDILDEARVELEWILKTQLDDGSFAHKVTALNFEGQVAPTADNQLRYFFSTSTTSTADAVAVLAASARIFADLDGEFASECLDAALSGQAFLEEHPEEITSDQEGASTGTYGSPGDVDERAWALAELWATTGEENYLQEFEAIASGMGVRFNFDWADAENLAVNAYLGAKSADRDQAIVESLTRKVVETADDMARESQKDPYGRGFNAYYWGSAGVVARMSLNLVMAHRIFPNRAYLDAISLKLDHILGLNPFARSWVTGLGSNPPQNPHHRPSVSDGVATPWPGLLIGGANPTALSWEEDYDSYEQNEIAINWNTALVYALVAARGTLGDEDAACVPDCLPEEPMNLGGAGGGGGASP